MAIGEITITLRQPQYSFDWYHKIAIQSTWNHPSNANKFTNRRWFCRVKSCVAKNTCHYISSPFWPHVQLCEGKLHETCVSSLTSSLEGKEQSKLLLFPRIEVTCCRKIPLSVAETGWYSLSSDYSYLPWKLKSSDPEDFPFSWVACSWKILAKTGSFCWPRIEIKWEYLISLAWHETQGGFESGLKPWISLSFFVDGEVWPTTKDWLNDGIMKALMQEAQV